MSARPVPTAVAERLDAGIKRYRPILDNARSRDVGEADTVTIIKDMMSDMFGYDKYEDLTSEFSIRGTYVDLAVKMGNTVQTLVEVKAIGCGLKDAHAKQAIDYAANQGVDWVILTNGQVWRVYHVVFAKPISADLMVEVDLCQINPGSVERDALYLWCKEGWRKSVLGQYKDQKQALSKFLIGSTLFSEPVLSVIKKELRRITPDVKIEIAQIAAVMADEVVKREIMERSNYEPKNNSTPEECDVVMSGGSRRKNLDLFEIGLVEGDAIAFVRDSSVVATVASNRKIRLDGQEMSLSAATAHVLGKLGASPGVSPSFCWKFGPDTLEEVRIREEAKQKSHSEDSGGSKG